MKSVTRFLFVFVICFPTGSFFLVHKHVQGYKLKAKGKEYNILNIHYMPKWNTNMI